MRDDGISIKECFLKISRRVVVSGRLYPATRRVYPWLTPGTLQRWVEIRRTQTREPGFQLCVHPIILLLMFLKLFLVFNRDTTIRQIMSIKHAHIILILPV